MFKNYLLLLSLFLASFFLSSCVDLIEEISINDDLSGHYEIRLETGGLGGLSQLLNRGNSFNFAEADIKKLDRTLNKLKKQEGISHVYKIVNPKDLKFYISFDFADEEALNNAIYSLANIKPNVFIKKFLKVKSNKIVRPNLNPYIQKIIRDKNLMAKLPSEDLLSYVNYVCIINVPKEIKNVSSSSAVLQNDGHTTIATINFKSLVLEKQNIRTKIKI